MATLFILFGSFVSTSFGSSCATNGWNIAYNPGQCDYEGGDYVITCPDKNNAASCGDRLQTNDHLGAGYYKANILSAPGDGTDSSLYLYTYGRNNNQDQPWNEIDIEILGNQVSSSSKVWTNLWTGFKVQHGQYVTLPWSTAGTGTDCAIQIAGSANNRTIYWIFNGAVYRWMYYGNFADVVSTVDNYQFQGNIVLWGAADDSWPDMGELAWNSHSFPIYAHFKNVVIAKGYVPHPSNFAPGVERPNWNEILKAPNKIHGSNLHLMQSRPERKNITSILSQKIPDEVNLGDDIKNRMNRMMNKKKDRINSVVNKIQKLSDLKKSPFKP